MRFHLIDRITDYTSCGVCSVAGKSVKSFVTKGIMKSLECKGFF